MELKESIKITKAEEDKASSVKLIQHIKTLLEETKSGRKVSFIIWTDNSVAISHYNSTDIENGMRYCYIADAIEKDMSRITRGKR